MMQNHSELVASKPGPGRGITRTPVDIPPIRPGGIDDDVERPIPLGIGPSEVDVPLLTRLDHTGHFRHESDLNARMQFDGPGDEGGNALWPHGPFRRQERGRAG